MNRRSYMTMMVAGVLAALAGAFIAAPDGGARSRSVTNGRIVFQSSRPPGDSSAPDIYTIDPNGANTVGPLTLQGVDDSDPAFSPDGTRIVWSTFEFAGTPCCSSIAVMNADGSNHRKVVNGADTGSGANGEPAWSPDGTTLAFVAGPEGASDIWTVNVDSGDPPTRITDDGTNISPAWSPDGTKVAFESKRDGDYEIYTMNPDGTDVEQITSLGGDQIQPAWSPDGTKIAYTSTSPDGYEIYVMDANGANAVQLTNNGVEDAAPAWSPDGTKIAFLSGRDSYDREIYTMNPDGSLPTRVTNSVGDDTHPSWAPGAPGSDTTPSALTIALSSPNGATPDGQNGWFSRAPCREPSRPTTPQPEAATSPRWIAGRSA